MVRHPIPVCWVGGGGGGVGGLAPLIWSCYYPLTGWACGGMCLFVVKGLGLYPLVGHVLGWRVPGCRVGFGRVLETINAVLLRPEGLSVYCKRVDHLPMGKLLAKLNEMCSCNRIGKCARLDLGESVVYHLPLSKLFVKLNEM